MGTVSEPDQFQSATIINGLPTVTFVSRPYRRAVTTVFMSAGINTSVDIYRGQLGSTGSKVSSNAFANPATYSVPFILPAGQSLWVVYGAAATPVNAAFARISTSRET